MAKEKPNFNHKYRYRYTCEHCGKDSEWLETTMSAEYENDIKNKLIPEYKQDADRGDYSELDLKGQCKNCKRMQSWYLGRSKIIMKRSPVVGLYLAGSIGGFSAFAVGFYFGLLGAAILFTALTVLGMVISFFIGLATYIRTKSDIAKTGNRFAPEIDWQEDTLFIPDKSSFIENLN